MKPNPVVAAALLVAIGAPAMLAAQTVSAEVTVSVPVKLTQIGPDVPKVRVTCDVMSEAFTTATNDLASLGTSRYVRKSQELPATGGQVTTTAALVFSFTGLDNPVGKKADVICVLTGWSTSQAAWVPFEPLATNLSLRTTATVPLLNTSFVW